MGSFTAPARQALTGHSIPASPSTTLCTQVERKNAIQRDVFFGSTEGLVAFNEMWWDGRTGWSTARDKEEERVGAGMGPLQSLHVYVIQLPGFLTLSQARLFLSCPQILPGNGCDRQAERREGDMTVCGMCIMHGEYATMSAIWSH